MDKRAGPAAVYPMLRRLDALMGEWVMEPLSAGQLTIRARATFGRDVRTFLRKGCRHDPRVPFGVRLSVTTVSSTLLMGMVPVGRQTSTPPFIATSR
jgi:hypothetical protein